ncbi:MAG TPA: hypothetical protein PKW18_13445 [Candidatus Sumerlaeota bacterium]|nr:hypothetical protein [Candidatus Sumerlaeota bacterium]HRR30603.1 hypothetical protein [Candidatus Sumerlaeia bacterium]HON49993.1 hypothetical protein [Candidatus Sumerlaeota bacterium]HOR65874.1 hypothetical protein [Candidatus Sumerlaeota bacterium]HPL75557.1 hypothetical protein [Candidatus Sumerlaeota bacterium]
MNCELFHIGLTKTGSSQVGILWGIAKSAGADALLAAIWARWRRWWTPKISERKMSQALTSRLYEYQYQFDAAA